MIQQNEPLSSKDFSKGLVTRSDILNPDPKQSPNCMDIKWYFDGAIGKRYGSSTTNTAVLGNAAASATAYFAVDSMGALPTNLRAYWKLDETSGTRADSVGTSNLIVYGAGVPSGPGILISAASFLVNTSSVLQSNSSTALDFNGGNLSISFWVNGVTTAATTFVNKTWGLGIGVFNIQVEADQSISFNIVNSAGGAQTIYATGTDDGKIFFSAGSWHNIIAIYSANAFASIFVNTVGNSGNLLTTNMSPSTGGFLSFGAASTTTGGTAAFNGRMDEIGVWAKTLTAQERSDLYNSGSADNFTRAISGADGYGWAMFDFGASSIRWLTVAAGTALYASSNLGTTFLTVHTSRTQTYQYLDRSKNVLIATSDAYDPPLYWAGSAGTSAVTLAAGSAPSVKYSINYQGFLILLNSATRKRGFFYADENLQLTDAWTNGFDLPSSADDEITAAFVLSKFLYVSTRYRIFFVSFVGGNPDWSYRKVRDWGFVPRTVRIVTLKGGQVAVGLDWQRRLRVFDGSEDLFISDNIENNNNVCDFATNKISYAGSGLVVSHAEMDFVEQEYRLNVAIGAQSTQVTHAIVLNTRTLALYPYSNQQYSAMAAAESNSQLYMMAVDRSGFIHILNSGNLDVSKPVNEIYDSPVLFKNIPGSVSKSQNNNLYFLSTSSGTVYYQEALNRSTVFSSQKSLVNLIGNENVVQVEATLDVPATYNTYEFRLSSSAGTAPPWKMTRWDFLQDTKGIGKA